MIRPGPVETTWQQSMTSLCGPHCGKKDTLTRHCTKCHVEHKLPMTQRPMHPDAVMDNPPVTPEVIEYAPKHHHFWATRLKNPSAPETSDMGAVCTICGETG